MRILRAAAGLLMAAGFAVAAHAQGMPGGYGGYGGGGGGGGDDGSVGGHIQPIVPSGPGDPEGNAEELRIAGHCDRAVPILRRLLQLPRTFPITKYNLGMCLLDLAAADGTAPQAAQFRQEGAVWIVRAANGGFDRAQAKAVTLYLDGIGVAADPVEAEKWALIYRHNGMRLALGLQGIPADVRDRLDGALSDAQQSEAQARADAWSPPPASLDE